MPRPYTKPHHLLEGLDSRAFKGAVTEHLRNLLPTVSSTKYLWGKTDGRPIFLTLPCWSKFSADNGVIYQWDGEKWDL